MKNTNKIDIYQEITDKIISSLEDGFIPWRKPWNAKNSGNSPFQNNFVSKEDYRGANQWLLEVVAHKENYASKHWLTFKQCKALGGNVKKGEKGTRIAFWKFFDSKEVLEDGTNKRIPMAKHYTVFNADQCEKLPERTQNTCKEFKPIEEAEKLSSQCQKKLAIEVREGGARAFYSPTTDYIQMPLKTSFESPEGYYSTLFHEMTHSTGHKSRLNREGFEGKHYFGDAVYSKEELVAEMGASYLSALAGISQETIENSSAYIASWLQKLRNDKKFVIQASSHAQKSCDYLLGKEFKK
jgi:antirestriction protein ArdC